MMMLKFSIIFGVNSVTELPGVDF